VSALDDPEQTDTAPTSGAKQGSAAPTGGAKQRSSALTCGAKQRSVVPTGGAKQGRGGRDDADGGNHRRDGRTAAEKVDLGSDSMLGKNDTNPWIA